MNIYSEVCGNGTSILTIHGIISDHNFFEGVIPYLSQQYAMISYDRRGYGKSIEENIDDYSVYAQVEDAYQVLKKYKDSPAYIVAHSAGSVIALELAICYPEAVKGLILIEPAFGFETESAAALKEWNCKLNGYAEERKLTKAFTAFFEVAGVKRSKKLSEKTGFSDMNKIKATMKNLENFMYGELNEIQGYLPDIEKIKKLEIPIIVGVGENEENNIFARASKKEAKIFGWPVWNFPGGHNSIEEEPEAIAKEVAWILNKLEKDGR